MEPRGVKNYVTSVLWSTVDSCYWRNLYFFSDLNVFRFIFQVDLFMWDVYRTLTEDEAGVLKAKLGEDELQLLRNNPFHITDSDIKVSAY